MRIAVFGDIHGNIEALKSAYDEALRHKPDKMFHLGDLGGYAPFVNEVVDFLIEHKVEGVQGNYDETVANDKEHCGCKYEDPIQAEMSTQGFNWTKTHATSKSKDYMRSLPFEIRFDAEDKKVIIFHATPKKNNLYWYEDRDEKFFKEMSEKVDADVFIYGHTHKPYRRDLFGKVFINAGSVGKPKDGDNRTCVTIIDITKNAVKSEFIRIPYDIEKVANAIVSSGLPPYFAKKLREAS
ncbi:MAG: metallophosphatase family protein [Thermodesulfovibrionales bacterium]|nr:metallophosphatase family protein [Thermodesulfovibrionales bacterium]